MRRIPFSRLAELKLLNGVCQKLPAASEDREELLEVLLLCVVDVERRSNYGQSEEQPDKRERDGGPALATAAAAAGAARTAAATTLTHRLKGKKSSNVRLRYSRHNSHQLIGFGT